MQPSPAPVWRLMSLSEQICRVAIASINCDSVIRRQTQTIVSGHLAQASADGRQRSVIAPSIGQTPRQAEPEGESQHSVHELGLMR